MKIAIIGAGFAGLSAAIGLNGHDITIFEQAPALKPVGAGVLIQPFGLSVLRQFGLDQKVIEAGDKINRLYGLTPSNRTILNLRYDTYQPDYFGVGIHRGSLFQLLYEKANKSNPNYRLNTTVTGIDDISGSPKVVLSNGEVSEPFDLVFVTNGSKSQLRSKILKKVYEEEYPWGALWGVFDNRDIDTTTLYQRYDSTTKLLGFLPCGQHPDNGKSSVSFFWSLRKTQHDALLQGGLESFKNELLAFEPACASLIDQMHSWDDFAYVTYTDVYLRNWMEGKVLFIGDSAHGMSPQLGLGANMAIYDGWLSGSLLREGGIEKLITLSDLRHKQNLFYHRVSRMMTPFFQSDHKLLGSLRDLTFPMLPHIRFLDKLMVETLYGTRDGLFSEREMIK